MTPAISQKARNPRKYRIEPFPRARYAIVDYLSVAHSRHLVHALLEVDVTAPRRAIREHELNTGEQFSFTAFIITCVARAVAENKHMHAYRLGRKELIVFDEVDVSLPVERDVRGHRIGTPHVIRAADTKTWEEIHRELRSVQAEGAGAYQRMEWSSVLPRFLGRGFWRLLKRNPQLRKRIAGTVGLTAVGMFGSGSGWGIPISDSTLQITLGGIAEKPGVVDGQVAIREYLSLTVSVDHDVVDGAPAARFIQRLKELIEAGHTLMQTAASRSCPGSA